MTTELLGKVITESNWGDFGELVRGALAHTIEQGEVPAFLGEPMDESQAQEFLDAWLEVHRETLLEAGPAFVSTVIRQFSAGDGPDQTAEEFEIGLVSMTAEQLTRLSEGEAEAVEAMKVDVIDRRRKLIADGLDVGRVLLRGAVATGLHNLAGGR